MVVTELQKKYSHICRVAYLCKHETACLVGAGMSLKHQIKELTGRDVYVPEYEDIKKSDRVNSAGRACYVERNHWIVGDSAFIILNKDPGNEKIKSGTVLVYEYAVLKKKKIRTSEKAVAA